ncbi:MAG: response regulator [Parabacteroides sp.]|nr:response regulator [Parabacteroides sp.]
MDTYEHLSKEESARLPEERESSIVPKSVSQENEIKNVISEVLMLLYSSEKRDSIDRALHLLMDFFDADWVYVATFDAEGKTVTFQYEVTSPWVENSKESVSELTVDTIPWMIGTLLQGNDIVVPDVGALPDEARTDKLLFDEQHLSSLLALPVTYNGEVKGLIGFDSIRVRRSWTRTEVENLHIIANIFSIIVERDKTQRAMRESRTRLRESGIRFRVIFENLPDGIELFDPNNDVVDINDTAADMFGISRRETIGANLSTHFFLPDKVKAHIREGRDFSCFCICPRKPDGADSMPHPGERYLQLKGVALFDEEVGRIGFLLIVLDDTGIHQKAEQTEENLAMLKAVLLNGRSIVGEYDLQRDVLFVDPLLNSDLKINGFFALFKDMPYLTKEKMFALVHPDDAPRNESLYRLIAQGKKKGASADIRVRVDGCVVWLRFSIQTYKTAPDGKPGKAILYLSDITEEKQLEAKLRQAEEEKRRSEIEKQKAMEADKLKSAFLANMSHEIRTPLNAIVGFSGLVAETDDREEQRNYLNIINRNSELLLGLITDILDFSRMESGKFDYTPAEVDIKEICTELCIVHSLKVPEGVNLVCPRDSLPSVTLYTDAKRITQVISNLLSNAVKFTRQGTIRLTFGEENDRVYIEVADTGIGIAPEYVDRIFQRFVKVNEFMQGTGLGLPICKNIVESLGGTITVQSEVGKGSVFRVTLPKVAGVSGKELGENDRQPNKAASVPVAVPPGMTPVILIAEDVEANYRLLEAVLKKEYELLHAWNGEEAVTLFKTGKPHLVLMDLKMPVMDGFEAAREIRRISDTVPIVALSAFAFENEKLKAKRCGFNEYLVKPLQVSDLKEILRSYKLLLPG